jgi:hypothetical protein
MLSGRFVVINPQRLSALPKRLQTVLKNSAENIFTQNSSPASPVKAISLLVAVGVKLYDLPEKALRVFKQWAQRGIAFKRELWGNYFIEMTRQLLHRHQPVSDNQLLMGLDADLTSSASQSGVAIKRGIELALDEINQAGGVLGK